MIFLTAATLAIGLTGNGSPPAGAGAYLFAPGKPVVQITMPLMPVSTVTKPGAPPPAPSFPRGPFTVRMQLSRNVVDWLADADERPTFDGRILVIDTAGRLRAAYSLQKAIITNITFSQVSRASGGNPVAHVTLAPLSATNIMPMPSAFVIPPDMAYRLTGCEMFLAGKALGGDPISIVLLNSASQFGATIIGRIGSGGQQSANFPGGVVTLKITSYPNVPHDLILRLTGASIAAGPTGGVVTTRAQTVRISKAP